MRVNTNADEWAARCKILLAVCIQVDVRAANSLEDRMVFRTRRVAFQLFIGGRFSVVDKL